jgi:alpha,alpha-trehalase
LSRYLKALPYLLAAKGVASYNAVTDMLSFPHFKKNIKSNLTKVAKGFSPVKASPDELLGELFQDVQLRRIYPDSITFVELVPANTLRKLLKEYEKQRQNPDFDLHEFVKRYFKALIEAAPSYKTNPNHTVEEHINELWNVLTYEVHKDRGSLLALPYHYIVPGGRYNAFFYWDTYFVMLGLAASNRYDMIEAMMKNYTFLIRKLGFIPTANRTYYLSRSQPPFFSHMVRLFAKKEGKNVFVKYLPYLLVEYRFWMKGHRQLHQQAPSYRRVVRLREGVYLNRYYDNKRTPRPESYKEDVDTAHEAPLRTPSRVYLDLRAAAESGWDFSSRWLADGQHLHTIHTTDIVPVDLNCLLYDLEKLIADTYVMLKQPLLAKPYQQRAIARAKTIQEFCWSEKQQFFMDYDFVKGQQTPELTLAGVFPLFSKIATPEQAKQVAHIIETKFLLAGGLTTALKQSGQQWDLPNGWALLQWITIQGLRNYGYYDLANTIKQRWIATNMTVYQTEGKLVEKYNVQELGQIAGGGEYALQDGFGMTNGVLMALLAETDQDSFTNSN